MNKPITISKDELNELLVRNNLKVQSSRITDTGVVRTISLNNHSEAKLSRLSKKFGISKSAMIRLLINAVKA